MICLDTNILIEITKNNNDIIEQLSSLNTMLCISSISKMELIIGARNNDEKTKLIKFINQFTIIHINENISYLASELIEKYAKSHHLDIPDALIAASCIDAKVKLWTQNIKDFHYLPKLNLL